MLSIIPLGGKLAKMLSGKLLIIFTPSLPTKLGGAGGRFGDFSPLDCCNFPYAGGCNHFTKYKHNIHQTSHANI